MILVRIRCARCNTALHEVDGRPESWNGNLQILRCQRCDLPDPRRIVDVMMKKKLDGIGLLADVPWSILRETIETAERKGKTQDFRVRVLDRPE